MKILASFFVSTLSNPQWDKDIRIKYGVCTEPGIVGMMRGFSDFTRLKDVTDQMDASIMVQLGTLKPAYEIHESECIIVNQREYVLFGINDRIKDDIKYPCKLSHNQYLRMLGVYYQFLLDEKPRLMEVEIESYTPFTEHEVGGIPEEYKDLPLITLDQPIQLPDGRGSV